jgi:hypothetical protein
MIIGDCPYCEETMINYMPDDSPMFQKIKCGHCGSIVWLLCSRIESIAYTINDFLELFEVDEETKRIRKR